MVYEDQAEMDQVLGKLDENSFINNQDKVLMEYQTSVKDLIREWKLDD
jgi:hypothetical protein